MIMLTLVLWVLIDKINSIDPESEQIQSLYSYLGDNNLEYCEGLPFYTSKEINSEKMDKGLKLCLAFKQIEKDDIKADTLKKSKKEDACNFNKDKQFRLNKDNKECSVEIVALDDLSNSYYKLFGEKLKESDDFNLSGSRSCFYDEKEGRYVCGDILVQTLQLGWAPTIFRMISKVKEKGDKIYLYDYFIAMNNNKCYLTNKGDKENSKCSDKIDENTKYNSRFVAKYGQEYLHVFEKNDDGSSYHWISTTAQN